MALFFNLTTLEKAAGNSSERFLALLQYHYNGVYIPKRASDKIKPVKMPGFSFLLNPAPIFNSEVYEKEFLVQYIVLAARRDYTLYKLHGYAALDLSFFPDIDLSKIKYNPLLNIVGKHLHFVYEEQYLNRKKS